MLQARLLQLYRALLPGLVLAAPLAMGCATETPQPAAAARVYSCASWDWVNNMCKGNPAQGVCIAQKVYFEEVCGDTQSYSAYKTCLSYYSKYDADHCVTSACVYYDLAGPEPPNDKLCP